MGASRQQGARLRRHTDIVKDARTMYQRIARTLRGFARLTDQHVSRTNAAEGTATLRRRRHEQERVDDYLEGRILTFPATETHAGQRGEDGVEDAL